MSSASNSSARILYQAETLIATTSFASRFLPDTIIFVTGALDKTLTLPKIGSPFAPVGIRVKITKRDPLGNGKVIIQPNAADSIDAATAGTPNALLLPALKMNACELEATASNDWDIVTVSYAP